MSLATPQPVTLICPAKPLAPAANARWSVAQIEALFALPFNDLLWQAQQVHRQRRASAARR